MPTDCGNPHVSGITTARNAAVDAWDFLTKTPLDRSTACHPLKGDLAEVTIDGAKHERWQYELPGGARIWYAVHEKVVLIERVHTSHPNETIKQFR